MFTGIVQETGKVKQITRMTKAYRLIICADSVGRRSVVGDSIAVNGVCLTLVEKKTDLSFDVVSNTFKISNLKRLKRGSLVNLEEALKVGDDISGHMVSGHIDCERKVIKNQRSSKGWIIDVEMKKEDLESVVMKGSVSVDGISLTVGDIGRNYFRVYLIPHTLQHTTLQFRRAGDYVNIEFDIIGKYANKQKNSISRNILAENGFI